MKNKGFTLIELLIVVAIIAILAAIAVPNFLEAQVRAKISRCKSDMRTMATAWECYRVDYNTYPPDFDGGAFGGSRGYPGEQLTFIVVTTPIAYLSSIPEDVFQQGIPIDQTKPLRLYEYWGWTAVQNGGNATAWAKQGILWAMCSFGPDRDRDNLANLGQANVVNAAYDPTNGTKSNGDIAISNKGFYP